MAKSTPESARAPRGAAAIERIDVSAYVVPTDKPESDGTLEWDRTTLVLVEARAGDTCGLGYTYADTATARLIHDLLAGVVKGRDAMDTGGAWAAMVRRIRNLGRPGICQMAISAVDAAIWDLKARLLGVPLALLLGRTRDAVPVYGSGGFTSYTLGELEGQLRDWVDQGIGRVKMKVGREPGADPARVRAARVAIGPHAELFVDANGAYDKAQALALAEVFAEVGVRWFEEPVVHVDLEGLRAVRDRAPAGMDIAAGEYGYDLPYFQAMLDAGAVDVLQADASRCGLTGFLQVAALCDARSMRLSSHCAPSLHVHAACAVPRFAHLEYFHDHVRLERLLFDGALTPQGGLLHPDFSRPGMGLEFKPQDGKRFRV